MNLRGSSQEMKTMAQAGFDVMQGNLPLNYSLGQIPDQQKIQTQKINIADIMSPVTNP